MVLSVDSGAVIDSTQRFRYRLWRIWDETLGVALFVMLNPSTADAQIDDATIRRCMRFAKDWGYGGIEVVNLYALRSRDPKALFEHADAIGFENDKHLRIAMSRCSVTVVAWGAHPMAAPRAAEVLDVLGSSAFCLGVTKDGFPRHPLYAPADEKLIPYSLPAS